MKDSLEELLDNRIAKARLGDRISSAEAAILLCALQVKPSIEGQIRILIDQAMTSSDPEFLVNLGDELMSGTLLPSDAGLAVKSYLRADTFSPYMGAYATGRAYFHLDPTLAEMYLSKAASAGHLASWALLSKLREPSPRILQLLSRLLRIPLVALRLIRGLFGKRTADTFWRLEDIARGPLALIDEHVGKDRNDHFFELRSRLGKTKVSPRSPQ